jgi:N-acetyl-anhydromuramyl-L-alanine amidase AmpD
MLTVVEYPEAILAPGPDSKRGYPGFTVNAGKGAIAHSMVGSYSAAYQRLLGEDRASWHFSITKDGKVYQHYSIRDICWHAGSQEWNTKLIGIEHEGGAAPAYSEPLTEAQRQALARLLSWLGKKLNWPEFRVSRDGQLLEHNWVYATACPSGRIPWADILERIKQMTTIDQAAMDRMRVAAAFGKAFAALVNNVPMKQALTADEIQVLKYIVALL